MIPRYYFFVAVLLVVVAATILVVPRPVYRKFLIYGLVLGVLPDILLVGLLGRVLHLFTWLNIGPANVFGSNTLVLLTFMFWTMLYLYFLPLRTAYLIPYVTLFAAIGVGMAQVSKSLGLFTYKPWFIYLMPFVFITWFTGTALIYRWQEKVISEHPVR